MSNSNIKLIEEYTKCFITQLNCCLPQDHMTIVADEGNISVYNVTVNLLVMLVVENKLLFKKNYLKN